MRVPGGAHTVTFRYRPRWRVAGPAVSLLGIALTFVLILAAVVPWRPGNGEGRP